jgi:hypothetical protein
MRDSKIFRSGVPDRRLCGAGCGGCRRRLSSCCGSIARVGHDAGSCRASIGTPTLAGRSNWQAIDNGRAAVDTTGGTHTTARTNPPKTFPGCASHRSSISSTYRPAEPLNEVHPRRGVATSPGSRHAAVQRTLACQPHLDKKATNSRTFQNIHPITTSPGITERRLGGVSVRRSVRVVHGGRGHRTVVMARW